MEEEVGGSNSKWEGATEANEAGHGANIKKRRELWGEAMAEVGGCEAAHKRARKHVCSHWVQKEKK